MFTRFFVAACSITFLLFLGACDSGDPDPPADSPRHLITFTYSGADDGLFESRGIGIAFATVLDGAVGLGGTEQDPAGEKVFSLGVNRPLGTGTFTFAEDCNYFTGSPDDPPCAAASFHLRDADDSDTYPYFLVDGSVQITEASSQVWAGTFSGTAVHMMSDDEITITDGEFNVGVID